MQEVVNWTVGEIYVFAKTRDVTNFLGEIPLITIPVQFGAFNFPQHCAIGLFMKRTV